MVTEVERTTARADRSVVGDADAGSRRDGRGEPVVSLSNVTCTVACTVACDADGADDTGAVTGAAAAADTGAAADAVAASEAPGRRRILDGIDLEVRRGECVMLVGRSGSGKTTVTKCVNGLIPSFEPGVSLSGSVCVCGLDPARCEMYELAERVGSVFQNPKSQFFNLTSNDELAFGLESRGVPVDEIESRIGDTVDALGARRLLGRNVTEMSGGERQSLVFASVDVARPDVYVLDEPTANLDAGAVQRLHDEVQAVLAEGGTVIIAEHRIYFAADLVDRALLVEGGRIVREFSPRELADLGPEERERLGLRAVDPEEALAVRVPSARTDVPADSRLSDPGLTLEGYAVIRGGRPVFEPVSVAVPAGCVLGVLGENGAGKTTLLRGIAGLERRDAGRVLLGGGELSRRARRRAVSLVMQDVNNQLFSDSVWNECVLSLGGREDAEARSRVEEMLSSLDLADVRGVHPMALSGGQKQRLAVACSLLSERRLILLDEPTSGLDLDHMKQVAGLVRSLADRGVAVALVTHDREFLNRCCDSALELLRVR